MYFYASILGVVIGIHIGLLANFSWFVVWFFCFIVLSISVLTYQHKYVIILFLCCVCFGFLRTSFIEHESILELFTHQKVTFEGFVVEEPDERIGKKHVVIRAEKLTEPRKVTLRENVRITLARHSTISYGDMIQVSGIVKKPQNFENERDITFDYIHFLKKDRVYTTMFYPNIQTLPEDLQSVEVKTKQKLFHLKRVFISKIEQQLPSPHAELMNGLLVGAKQGLGEDLLEKFRKTGLIHIVVLSGFNVMIVAHFFLFVFSFFPRWLRFILATTSIILFALMTGGSATTVRASIMAILGLIASISGRTYTLNRALFFAGAVMLLHNPMILLYDPSFQLSFIATLGLINLAPSLQKKIPWITKKYGMREIIAATISTQIAVAPLLLSMMGELSIIALPANLLVLPVIPITMLTGFLLIISSFVAPLTSPVFMIFSYILLEYEIFIVELFSKIPFASIGF